MINKCIAKVEGAVTGIKDGSTVMIRAFGTAGMSFELIDALIAHGAGNRTVISNNAGNGDTGLAVLLKAVFVRDDDSRGEQPL